MQEEYCVRFVNPIHVSHEIRRVVDQKLLSGITQSGNITAAVKTELDIRSNPKTFDNYRLWKLSLALESVMVRNRAAALGLSDSSGFVIHPDDATSVDQLVQRWRDDPNFDSPVKYYKAAGVVNGDTSEHIRTGCKEPDFGQADFLLVWQTHEQSLMMLQYCRLLFVDATHEVTAYGYFLLSILVPDRFGNGLAVAFAISSRDNARTWELFGKALRPASRSSKPEVMMSDDTNSTWNGFMPIWCTLKFKLLCHWHVMRRVREHCCGEGKKIDEKVVVPKDVSQSSKTGVTITKDSYGISAWQQFYCLLREEDEDKFGRDLESFRQNLRAHGQTKLLKYFERTYFKPERIKQWATWYRNAMYNCEWIANVNMHVESWHNILKTDILKRKVNVRVDTLLYALKQAESLYCAKWNKVNMGWVKHFNPAWTAMVGETTCPSITSSFEPKSRPTYQVTSSKSFSRTNQITDSIMRLHTALHTKIMSAVLHDLDLEQLQLILKHFRNIDATIGSRVPKHLVTTAVPVSDQKLRVIPAVRNQYKKFKRKRPRVIRNSTNIKMFRNHDINRNNHQLSISLSTTGGESVAVPSVFPKLLSKIMTLSIRKVKNCQTLGGITFSPMLSGIVIPVTGTNNLVQMESLHVRVWRVERNSTAYKQKVTTTMYLKSMALVDKRGTNKEATILMGAKGFRTSRSKLRTEGDIWRDAEHKQIDNTIDLKKIAQCVEMMLQHASIHKKNIEIELVQYDIMKYR